MLSTKFARMTMNSEMTPSSPSATNHITSSHAIAIFKKMTTKLHRRKYLHSLKVHRKAIALVLEKPKSEAPAIWYYLVHFVTSKQAGSLKCEISVLRELTVR